MDLVHIDDVLSALIEAIRRVSDEPVGGIRTYQIRTGEAHSLKSLVGVIEKASETKLNVVFGGRPYRNREVMRPYSGGDALPNWRAKTSFLDGIKEILKLRLQGKPEN